MKSRTVLHTRERGVALFIVLIALVAMALSALTTLRSIDTSLLMSGNFAFRNAATQVADVGIEAAVTALPTIISTSQETLVPGQYYPSRTPAAGGLTWDSDGLPPQAVWANATAVATNVPNGFTVAYIVERMCNGTLPINNIVLSCIINPAADNGSAKSGGHKFTGGTPVYYRVTVRVLGPHSTVRYVQTTLSY